MLLKKNLTNGVPIPSRTVEFYKTADLKGNYSADIIMPINNEKLNLRFALEKQDYEVITNLIQEINDKDRLLFKGVWSSSQNSQELGITIKTAGIEIDLIIDSTKKLISNLIWFQSIENKNEIENLIIKKP